jgi:hypothetical protein
MGAPGLKSLLTRIEPDPGGDADPAVEALCGLFVPPQPVRISTAARIAEGIRIS